MAIHSCDTWHTSLEAVITENCLTNAGANDREGLTDRGER